MLTITNGPKSFVLDCKGAIEMELKLNVTTRGNEWSYIGDSLYKYGCKMGETDETLVVTPQQYDFLEKLREKESWRDCNGM